MQKNSAANSTPASRPPGRVRSASKSGVPRLAAQSQTSSAPPTERAAACQSAGISGIAALAATWFRPQRKQQKTMVTTAKASRWALRSVIALHGKRPPSNGGLRDRRGDDARRQAAGVRERGDRDVPAFGAAQHLGGPRRLARHLERERGEEGEANRPAQPGGR